MTTGGVTLAGLSPGTLATYRPHIHRFVTATLWHAVISVCSIDRAPCDRRRDAETPSMNERAGAEQEAQRQREETGGRSRSRAVVRRPATALLPLRHQPNVPQRRSPLHTAQQRGTLRPLAATRR